MTTPAQTSFSDLDKYRLPTNVKPTHYDLVIRTDLEKLEYCGYVKVKLAVNKETSSITFNCADLDLERVVLYSEGFPNGLESNSQSVDKDNQRITCEFEKVLPAGSQAELAMNFCGELTGSMLGYYRSSYELDGKEKFYALTQFEPTSAREAFPCWDEPSLKATFSITMISREDTVNLSNMAPSLEKPILELDSDLDGNLASLLEDLDGNWKVTVFEKTPPMSTYLVAFANGHLEHIEDWVKLRERTIPIRIYATLDLIHQAQFALHVKKKVLPLYEEVFDVTFPLPKLDTLVVTDFEEGAMENWGLITGRTNALLLDPEDSDLSAKQLVAATISHEVAHMWFGNIVTMEWWDNLYLNEGFATLVGEVIMLDRIFPEWKADSTFIFDHLSEALTLDAKISSHAIEVACFDANDINQIFDDLSYSKAASVLRMLSKYVGEELFLKGVSLYLKERLYGNSVTKDLWDGIAKATGKDIVGIMTNWIEKMGFPVLTVTETESGIKVRQDRFLENGIAEDGDNQTIWNLPLNILSLDTDGKPTINRMALLTEREQIFELDTSKPYKLNSGTSGVYRVLYTADHLSKLAKEAGKPEGQGILGPEDRAGLVQDVVALSKAGLTTLSSALTLINGLNAETEYIVWAGIAEALSALVSIWWEDEAIVNHLNAFRRELFVPVVDRLGYENQAEDEPDTVALRTLAVTQAANAKSPVIVKELRSRFAYYVKTGDDSKIPADLQKVIFAMAIEHGGKEEYNAAIEVYENSKTPAARISAILAMGTTHNPELQQETLNYISSENSRDQDVVYFCSGLKKNFKTRRLVARYLMDNYDMLYERLEGAFTFSQLVERCFGELSSTEDADEIETFFKGKDTSEYTLALEQTLDAIRTNAAFVTRSTDDVKAWLGSKSP